MFDTIFHRWLKIPYLLHITYHGRVKKPRATILFLHGIGNSGEAWQRVIEKLPLDVQAITIDLLGFGKSPKPTWATYNAKAQAHAVLRSYFVPNLTPSRLIVVGHSMGSLVAVEIARRYPLLISQLILCGPPFYDVTDKSRTILPQSDKVLRSLYQTAANRPDQFVKLTALFTKYKLVNPTFNVTEDNVSSYIAALEAMIINQTSLEDARQLSVPTHILRGTLDPFVLASNLKQLARDNPNIDVTSVIAGHEVTGRFVPAVVQRITDSLPNKK